LKVNKLKINVKIAFGQIVKDKQHIKRYYVENIDQIVDKRLYKELKHTHANNKININN